MMDDIYDQLLLVVDFFFSPTFTIKIYVTFLQLSHDVVLSQQLKPQIKDQRESKEEMKGASLLMDRQATSVK